MINGLENYTYLCVESIVLLISENDSFIVIYLLNHVTQYYNLRLIVSIVTVISWYMDS